MSRNEAFRADDEASETLRNLSYSEEQIGATVGQLPEEMPPEEKLRLSLRALSSQHSADIQEEAAKSAPPPNPKLFNKQESTAGTEEEAYARGRRDERYLKRNDPNYVRPARAPRARKKPDLTTQLRRLQRKSRANYRKLGGR